MSWLESTLIQCSLLNFFFFFFFFLARVLDKTFAYSTQEAGLLTLSLPESAMETFLR